MSGAPAHPRCSGKYLSAPGPIRLGLIGSGRERAARSSPSPGAPPAIGKGESLQLDQGTSRSFARSMSGLESMSKQSTEPERRGKPTDGQLGDQFALASDRTGLDQTGRADRFDHQRATAAADGGGSRVIVSWKEEVLGGEAPRQPYMAMIGDGSWSAAKIAGELGDVILGKIPGRAEKTRPSSSSPWAWRSGTRWRRPGRIAGRWRRASERSFRWSS